MSISKGFPRGHRCDRAGTGRQRDLAPSPARHWIGGAAVSLLPLLSGRASATTTTSSTSDTTAATTTTTAPPKRPTDDDVALLGFAQTVELAARELYDVGTRHRRSSTRRSEP